MVVNHTTLQAITNVTGMLFLFVATTANSPACHKANLHIDSVVQVFAVAKNDKFRKYLPVITVIFTVLFLKIIALIHLVSVQESITRNLIRKYKFRPRSPPAARIIRNGNHYFGCLC